jgi:ubiquinone biosynthesis UbiH/UbiF/VisC/COQ6 family hydroxylase
MAPNTPFDADVLVVGAGPAGLALGIALADAGLQVTLLEQQGAAALAEPAEDGREIALTHRARRIMADLGLWDRLAADAVSPLNEARVVDGSSPLVLHFGEQRAGADGPLGWLVPNHLIRRAAWQVASARSGVRLCCEARVTAIERDAHAARITLADGRRLSARLLVAADSRFSATRRLAGIGAAMHDFGRSVVVGRIVHEQDHGGVAWEAFRYGNTLALLPLNDRISSAVVTLPADRAAEWLALPDAEFAACGLQDRATTTRWWVCMHSASWRRASCSSATPRSACTRSPPMAGISASTACRCWRANWRRSSSAAATSASCPRCWPMSASTGAPPCRCGWARMPSSRCLPTSAGCRSWRGARC